MGRPLLGVVHVPRLCPQRSGLRLVQHRIVGQIQADELLHLVPGVKILVVVGFLRRGQGGHLRRECIRRKKLHRVLYRIAVSDVGFILPKE